MFEEKKPEAKTAANAPEPAKKAPVPITPTASNNAVPVRKSPATTAERVAAAVAAAKPPPSEAAAAVPRPRDAAPGVRAKVPDRASGHFPARDRVPARGGVERGGGCARVGGAVARAAHPVHRLPQI